MSKNDNSNISIFDLEIKNRNIFILTIVGGLSILFSILDFFTVLILYKNYFISLYCILFRIAILLAYLLYTPTVYQFYKSFLFILFVIMLPTILLASYVYLDLFGLIWTLIIWSIYGILLRLVYVNIKNTNIDYKKSAKNLLKIYPKSLDMKNKHYGVIKKEKIEKLKSNNIFISFFSHIPIWVLFLFPLISAEIAVAYLSKSNMGGAIMGMELLLCIIFMYAGFSASNETKIFNEAQKILDEKANKNNGK